MSKGLRQKRSVLRSTITVTNTATNLQTFHSIQKNWDLSRTIVTHKIFWTFCVWLLCLQWRLFLILEPDNGSGGLTCIILSRDIVLTATLCSVQPCVPDTAHTNTYYTNLHTACHHPPPTRYQLSKGRMSAFWHLSGSEREQEIQDNIPPSLQPDQFRPVWPPLSGW